MASANSDLTAPVEDDSGYTIGSWLTQQSTVSSQQSTVQLIEPLPSLRTPALSLSNRSRSRSPLQPPLHSTPTDDDVESVCSFQTVNSERSARSTTVTVRVPQHMPRNNYFAFTGQMYSQLLCNWNGYRQYVCIDGVEPANCDWYDRTVKWFNDFVVNANTMSPRLMNPTINPFGITVRQERHLFLYGPREMGKSKLVSLLFGDFDFLHRTYRPENHPRFFMNHYNPLLHKYILFENFNFDAFARTMLIELMDSHMMEARFPTFSKKSDTFSQAIRHYGPIVFISSSPDKKPDYMARLRKSKKNATDEQVAFRDSFFSRVTVIDANEAFFAMQLKNGEQPASLALLRAIRKNLA